MAAISIRNLKFAYEKDNPVLDIPSLDISSGEKVFLFGPSGSGKTTLLGLMAGVLEGSSNLFSGDLNILDQNLAKLSVSQRDSFRGLHIGYIFQLFNLIPYLSVIENICLPCVINSKRRAKIKCDLNRAAEDLAIELGLKDFLHKPVLRLSVGQQQRVAVARALLGEPEILIADEPTSALDADHRQKFIELLFEQASRTRATLIFVSHDQSLAKSFDRNLSLNELNRVGAR
ncbi:MAG: ABC transporter ATP-binding protein [Deltaproteobacteria bacterium]|nr:ABC transporter ATP-binding protein [Deltaproteobacteria bacterium]